MHTLGCCRSEIKVVMIEFMTRIETHRLFALLAEEACLDSFPSHSASIAAHNAFWSMFQAWIILINGMTLHKTSGQGIA
jgi:hypothetical protein